MKKITAFFFSCGFSKPQCSRTLCLLHRLLREQKCKREKMGMSVRQRKGIKKKGCSLCMCHRTLPQGLISPCLCCRSVNGWHHKSLHRGCLLQLLSQVHHYADSLTLGKETKQPPTGVDQSSDARRNPENISTALKQPTESIQEGIQSYSERQTVAQSKFKSVELSFRD